MRRHVAILLLVGVISAPAGAQSTGSAETGPANGTASRGAKPGSPGLNPVNGEDPKAGQIAGGGDPSLLKNGTGNAQSPAVPTGGPTSSSANPSQ